MLAAIVDTMVVAAGGILTAGVGGGFAFAGVVYTARQQARPVQVTIDAGELAELRAELVSERRRADRAEAERDHWRDLAQQWLPRRRFDEQE